MASKSCRKCSHLKPLTEFSRQTGTRDGLRTWCRACVVQSSKSWRLNNVHRHNDHHRVSRLRKLGVTVDINQVSVLRVEQANKCAICGKPETSMRHGQVSALSMDHCHKTKKLRGLLCRRCNTGIANFDDDIARLQSAMNYLLQHQIGVDDTVCSLQSLPT